MSVPRVRLVPPNVELLDAALEDPPALARLLGCELAEGWNMFPEVVREARGLMVAHPESTRWGLRLLVVIDEP